MELADSVGTDWREFQKKLMSEFTQTVVDEFRVGIRALSPSPANEYSAT